MNVRSIQFCLFNKSFPINDKVGEIISGQLGLPVIYMLVAGQSVHKDGETRPVRWPWSVLNHLLITIHIAYWHTP
jgi:hypothetical protein